MVHFADPALSAITLCRVRCPLPRLALFDALRTALASACLRRGSIILGGLQSHTLEISQVDEEAVLGTRIVHVCSVVKIKARTLHILALGHALIAVE
jgi:hypothetical protein